MLILRWIQGNTMSDKMRIENICVKIGVTLTEENMTENRLKQFGYMQHKPN